MRTLGVARPQLTSREVADLIAFLYVLDYFEASGDAAVGKRIFGEKRCIACHRVGDVGGVVGPDLSPSSRYVTPIQMAAAMWNHGPAMSEAMQVRGIARPRFTSAELRDLIAYVEADQPDVPSDPVFVLPGFAGDGQRVFTEKGCSECHAVRGSGGRIGPDLAERRVSPSILAFAVAMWNKAPAMTRATAARGASIPRLLPGEMADIVGYLYAVNYFAESGNPARGPHLLNRKGCLKCHSGNGREGASAGRLGTSERFASPAAVIAALWNHVLLGELAEAGAGRWPQLRPADLADLTAFLQRPMR
jgi:mono/diheme cytochrome c family protein